MTGHEACVKAKALLSDNGLYNANELNTLFFAATGLQRIAALQQPLSASQQNSFFELVARRIAGEPLQYLAGEWPFLDFTVKVDHRALIPRPETELLAETAVKLCALTPPRRILDLCSGSGVLAFAMKRAFPQAAVSAVELSQDAFSLLTENAQRLCCDIDAVQSDAEEYLCSLPDSCADLIVSNPPYVTQQEYSENIDELRFEPRMAFIGGDDGLLFYRTLIPACRRVLKHGGVLAFEIGDEQGEAVSELFAASGYCDITTVRDLSGLDRIVWAKKA